MCQSISEREKSIRMQVEILGGEKDVEEEKSVKVNQRFRSSCLNLVSMFEF